MKKIKNIKFDDIFQVSTDDSFKFVFLKIVGTAYGRR